jgi:hypothetical protein
MLIISHLLPLFPLIYTIGKKKRFASAFFNEVNKLAYKPGSVFVQSFILNNDYSLSLAAYPMTVRAILSSSYLALLLVEVTAFHRN